jgi:hypothetical protein
MNDRLQVITVSFTLLHRDHGTFSLFTGYLLPALFFLANIIDSFNVHQ